MLTRSVSILLATAAIVVQVSHPALGQTTDVSAPSAQTDETKLATPASPELQKLLGEAQELQGRHRYFDALAKLEDAERIAPKDPNIYNIRGAIYLVPAVREFDKARENFDKALALEPTALAPKFNLAELEFVKHSFAEAATAFAAILKNYPKLQMPVRHLVAFKILVSESMQGKSSEAEKTLKTYFTFMDDTPAYYFSKASLAFAAKNEKEANEWLEKAKTIFKAPENAPYLDSLMEARLIPNIMLPPSAAK